MDVDRRHRHPPEELAAQHLHVAGQHEQLGRPSSSSSHPRLRLASFVRRGRRERGGRARPPRASRARGRDGWRSPRRSPCPSSPRRRRQSRSSRQWSWRETRIALRRISPHQRSCQSISKRAATSRPEGLVQSVRCRPLGQEELGAQEEAPAAGVGGVLVGGDDVRLLGEQEARDRRDDARAIGAGDQQPRRVVRRLPALAGRPISSPVSRWSSGVFVGARRGRWICVRVAAVRRLLQTGRFCRSWWSCRSGRRSGTS